MWSYARATLTCLNPGVMEYWSTERPGLVTFFHYSSTPLLQLLNGYNRAMFSPTNMMVDSGEVERRLQGHVHSLSVDIGERSIYEYARLCRAERYVFETLRSTGYEVERQVYRYRGRACANLVTSPPIASVDGPKYLLTAHYDTVLGTPGADDNASAVAILLEIARLGVQEGLALGDKGCWRFVGFSTEEPPAFHTRHQGSRVFAREARRRGTRIDGIVNLEMLGYFVTSTRSQWVPFPINLFGYSRIGNFVAVVANWKSRHLARRLVEAMRRNPSMPVEKLVVPERGFLFFPARLSDHSSFWDHGYPAVMVTDTAFLRNPHYHSRSDTIDKLNFPAMTEVVRSLLLFLKETTCQADGRGRS